MTGVLERYDSMMERYVPDREGRFDALLDAVAALAGASFVALDAACGPGSLAKRLLERFPRARCVAVDADPAMLDIARPLSEAHRGRLALVHGDLLAPEGIPELAGERFDVVATTSSTHYLDEARLHRFYRVLGHLLSPGGILLNGDELAVDPGSPALRTLVRSAAEARQRTASRRGVDDWTAWWKKLGRTPTATDDHHRQPLHGHRKALDAAGFEHVTILWQHLDAYLLLATR